MEKVVNETTVAERGELDHDETILKLALRFMNEPDESERLEEFMDAYIRDDSQTYLKDTRNGENVRFSVVHGTFVDADTGTIYQMRTDASGYHKEVYKCETERFYGVLATPGRVFDARSTGDFKMISADYYAGDNHRTNMRPLLESPSGYEPGHSIEQLPNRNSLRMQKNDDGSVEGWVNDGIAEQEHRVYSLDEVVAKMHTIQTVHADFERQAAELEASAVFAGQVGHRAVALVEAA